MAAAAGMAIENARLFDLSHRRELWLRATNEAISNLLIDGAADTALMLLATRAQEIAGAPMAAVLLPDERGENLVFQAVAGLLADELLGLALPIADSNSGDAFRGGTVRVLDNVGEATLARSATTFAIMPPAIRELGPAVFMPLAAGRTRLGVLIVAKPTGERGFDAQEVRMIESFAGHAALAMEFATAQEDRRRLAVYEDRDRIARDLHDVVVQRLFAVGLGLQGAKRHDLSQEARQDLAGFVEQIDLTIREIRKSIFSLHETPNSRRGLRADLLLAAQECAVPLGFEPTLQLEGPLDSVVADNQRHDLLATLREALSNVARHARAGSVTVLVTVDPATARLHLVVQDDGVGMPDRHVRTSGLANMSQRAYRWRGSFEVDSPQGHGTRVRWSVPLRVSE